MFLEWCTGYLLLSNKLPQICCLRTIAFINTQSLWVRNPTQSNYALWPIIRTGKLLLSVSCNSKILLRRHHTPHSLTWLLAGFSSQQSGERRAAVPHQLLARCLHFFFLPPGPLLGGEHAHIGPLASSEWAREGKREDKSQESHSPLSSDSRSEVSSLFSNFIFRSLLTWSGPHSRGGDDTQK